MLSAHELRERLATCHAFLLPFKVPVSEVPLVVIEAGLSGRPLVVLDAPGVSEYAHYFGGLVGVTPEALPALLLRACARTPIRPADPRPWTRWDEALEPVLAWKPSPFSRYRFVGLIGVDGSGKTFLLDRLSDGLRRAGVPYRRVWSRFRNYLSKPLLAAARLTGHNRKEQIDGVRIGYHEFAQARPLAFLFLGLQVLDQALDLLLRYRLPWRRELVVGDRCVLDTLVDLAVDTGPRRPRDRPDRPAAAAPPAAAPARRPGQPAGGADPREPAGRAARPQLRPPPRPLRAPGGPLRHPGPRQRRLAGSRAGRAAPPGERWGRRPVIYVFYNNDPLADDLGGGAEHFRGLHRALLRSELPFRLVAARLQEGFEAPYVDYISRGSSFGRYYLGLWRWFWRHRHEIRHGDVFHFHRNYAAWPKLLFCADRGAGRRQLPQRHRPRAPGHARPRRGPAPAADAAPRAPSGRASPTPSSASAAATRRCCRARSRPSPSPTPA